MEVMYCIRSTLRYVLIHSSLLHSGVLGSRKTNNLAVVTDMHGTMHLAVWLEPVLWSYYRICIVHF